jgi:tRNA A37 threonylcarbamoyltransferase TsaD
MPLPVWIGLGVLVLATAGGAVFVVMRAREAWQTFRSCGRTLDDATNEMLDRLARVQKRMDALDSSTPRVQGSLERLRADTDVLKMELRVLQDVRAPLMRFRAVVIPRK